MTQKTAAPPPLPPTAASPWPHRLLALLALSVIAVATGIRLWLRGAALDDAEGEFAYTGRLLLQGIPPFRAAVNMKLPGASAFYALLMSLFGQSPAGIHIGLAVVNLATVAVLFFLGKKLYGGLAGWVTAASYALLSLGSGVLGTIANAEHFVLLPALLATLQLLRWKDTGGRGTLASSGLLYGLAVVIKQSGIFFAFFGATCLVWFLRDALKQRKISGFGLLGIFAMAGLLPLAATCLWFWEAGVFPKFWFWTVTYGRAYASIVPAAGALRILSAEMGRIIAPFEALWLLAADGLILACMACRRAKEPQRETACGLLAFLGFSVLALCPGLYFRFYYFVLLLPALALFCGAAAELLRDYLPEGERIALFAIVVLFSVFPQRHHVFGISDGEFVRALSTTDAFVVAGDYVRENTAKDARIAVLGSEPQVYFYAGRAAATSYIFTYPLGEPQPYAGKMQDEMIAEIKAARPAYIIALNMPPAWMFLPGYCVIGSAEPCDMFKAEGRPASSGTAWEWDYETGSWILRRGVPTQIFDWSETWLQQHYVLEGIVDSLSASETVSRFGAEAASYEPQSQNYIRIFKLRGAAAPEGNQQKKQGKKSKSGKKT